MDYRSEREALRGRVQNLEEDLAGAQRELESAKGQGERVAELEKRMADARRMLEDMQAELDRVRGDAPARGRRRRILGVLVMGLGVGLGLLAMQMGRPAPPERIAAPLPPPAPELPVVPQVPVRDTRVVPPPKPGPAPEPRRAVVRWPARVTHATGVDAKSCAVTAALAAKGDDLDVPLLEVTCGERVLYRSTDPLNGMSTYGSAAEEDPGPTPGSYVYRLRFEDKGTRSSSRAEVSIDTGSRAGSVWSDSAPRYRVDFALEPASVPRTGEPLSEATARIVRADAVVGEVKGDAVPVRRGARCTLRAAPMSLPGKCLVRIACGQSMLYGGGDTGIADCTFEEGGRILTAFDGNPSGAGGDPTLDLDLRGRRAVLTDEVSGAAWKVVLTLEPPKALGDE